MGTIILPLRGLPIRYHILWQIYTLSMGEVNESIIGTTLIMRTTRKFLAFINIYSRQSLECDYKVTFKFVFSVFLGIFEMMGEQGPRDAYVASVA